MATDIGSSPKPWNYESFCQPIVFCKVWGDKINTKGSFDHRLLECNETGTALYKGNTFSKNISLSRAFRWFSLEKVVQTKPGIIEFIYKDGSIVFRHKDAQEIVNTVLFHVFNILSPSERPIVESQSFKPEAFVPSQYAALMRFRSRLFGLGQIPSIAFLNKFSLVLKKLVDTIDLCSFEGFEMYYDNLLFSLVADPRIRIIIYPQTSDGQGWLHISRCLTINSFIHTIHLKELMSDKFYHVMDALKKNSQSQLKHIIFQNSEINSNSLICIKEFLDIWNLTNLSFIRALKGLKPEELLSVICQSKNYKSILCVRFIDSSIMDFNTICLNCFNFTSLTLSNCEIEISKLFGSLVSNPLKSLITLDLSKNSFLRPIPNDFPLRKLENFIIDDCAFTSESLISVLKSYGSLSSASLSISRALIDNREWNDFFSQIVNLYGCKLFELIWNENKVTSSFLVFISRITELRKLSLDGCFTAKNDIIADINEFIEFNEYIIDISLSAIGNKAMSSSGLFTTIGALRENRSINTIRLLNYVFDESLIFELTDILTKNRVINTIEINNFNTVDISLWRRFLSRLVMRGKPLKLIIPNEEFESFKNQKNINENEINSFLDLLKLVSQGDSTIRIPEETEKRTNRPSTTSRFSINNQPISTNEELIQQPLSVMPFIPISSFNVNAQNEASPVIHSVLAPISMSSNPKPTVITEGIVVPEIIPIDMNELITTLEVQYGFSAILNKLRSA